MLCTSVQQLGATVASQTSAWPWLWSFLFSESKNEFSISLALHLTIDLEPQFLPNQVPIPDFEVSTFQNWRMLFYLLCATLISTTWSHSFFPTKCPAFPPQQDFDWNAFAENTWWDGIFLVLLNHIDVHVYTNSVHTLIWSDQVCHPEVRHLLLLSNIQVQDRQPGLQVNRAAEATTFGWIGWSRPWVHVRCL